MSRDNSRAALVLAFLAALVVAHFACGCGANRTPTAPPDRPAKIYAEITVVPPLSIAYRPITLTARLIDPSGVVSCPRITWTLPDGTHSSRVSDCSPDDRASGKVDVKRGMLPPGDFRFEVEFDSQGHRWRAQRTVSIPGAE